MNGDVLWSPPADWRDTTELGRYLDWLWRERDLSLSDFNDLHRWSVTDQEGFWGSVADFFQIRFHSPRECVLTEPIMPGAKWFPGATLNYAEHLVGDAESLDSVAVIGRSQTRPAMELTYAELRDQVARARAGLQRLGVGKGDRVAAYMPNIPETLVAFIATVSLGAIWAACAAEFGPRSVIDRLSQIDPKVLLVVPGYGYRDRYVSRTHEVTTVRAGLPTVKHVISVTYGEGELPKDAVSWDDLIAEAGPLEFEPVPFDHALYVLFSSGTTGLPKPIIHSHGGQLVEHYKNLSFSWDMKRGARLLWFSTTAWMMWNMLVAGLLFRASIVMLDGDPTWPDLMEQWRIADEVGATVMGASSVYLMACRKAGLLPGKTLDLEALRVLCTAGSPFPGDGYRWVYEHLDPALLFVNGSGGTDICSGILGGSFAQPVYEGELTAPYLAWTSTHSISMAKTYPSGNSASW
jgi:acetoacetyl-CoA synthetase